MFCAVRKARVRATLQSVTFEEYRDAWWQRERQTDADMRAGIICGERVGYVYVGPPLMLTPERWILRAWLSHVEARASAFCRMIEVMALRMGG